MNWMENSLAADGFYKETAGWSFTPVFSGDGIIHYSKDVWMEGIEDAFLRGINIGVLLNIEYETMEVYMCYCQAECCGDSQGIHPFSIKKIEELLHEYHKTFNE